MVKKHTIALPVSLFSFSSVPPIPSIEMKWLNFEFLHTSIYVYCPRTMHSKWTHTHPAISTSLISRYSDPLMAQKNIYICNYVVCLNAHTKERKKNIVNKQHWMRKASIIDGEKPNWKMIIRYTARCVYINMLDNHLFDNICQLILITADHNHNYVCVCVCAFWLEWLGWRERYFVAIDFLLATKFKLIYWLN